MSAAAPATPESLVPSGTWVVDSERSQVGFDLRHLKVLRTRGRFERFDGTVAYGKDGTAAISGTVSVDSIETDDPKRDERLLEADFFDAERHPSISFEGTALPAPGSGPFEIRGRLAIKGVSRKLVLIARPEAGTGDGDAVRIRAEGVVSRRDFGLDWDTAFATGGLLIDDHVHLALDIVAVRVRE